MRCSKRKTIADELLSAQPAELEGNCRKVLLLCRQELEYVSREGRFDVAATSRGSLLFAIISAIADLLQGDTQLVESINSIIRFVSTRCPAIDLHTMSARLTCKKAVTGSLGGSQATKKRWSAVEAFARPLLQDLSAAGPEYKVVLDATHRFQQPGRQTLQELEPSLSNVDLAVAFPDMLSTPASRWAGTQARKLKVALDSCARRQWGRDGLGRTAAAAGVTVFCLQENENAANRRFYMCVGSCRSSVTLAELELTSEGRLRLRGNCFQFTSTSTLLRGCYTDGQARYQVFANCVLQDADGGLLCLTSDPSPGRAALETSSVDAMLLQQPLHEVGRTEEIASKSKASEEPETGVE